MLEDGASGLFPFSGRFAECFHISYEVSKSDIHFHVSLYRCQRGSQVMGNACDAFPAGFMDIYPKVFLLIAFVSSVPICMMITVADCAYCF